MSKKPRYAICEKQQKHTSGKSWMVIDLKFRKAISECFCLEFAQQLVKSLNEGNGEERR